MIYELQITTAARSKTLINDIYKRFTWLEQHGYYLDIDRVHDDKSPHLSIDLKLQGTSIDSHYRKEDMVFIFKHQIAEYLAEHIIDDWERELAWKETVKKDRHILPGDQRLVCDKAIDFLKRCHSNESLNLLMNYGRKNKMAHKLFDYVYDHNLLVVEGFIKFCMQDYLTEIKFAVDLACEELKNEKEYNEFVKLLRYFVDTQPPMVQEVNIVMDKQGHYRLWDGNGKKIEEKHIDYYLEDLPRGEINLDDILVSILITIAPRRIVLHNIGLEPGSEPVKMIKNVFAERISECKGCERCFKYKQKDGSIT